jgi:hypothetical protein
MNDDSTQRISMLLETDLDELYSALGKEVAGPGMTRGTRNLRKLGREWLKAKREQLSAAVCHDPKVRALCEDGKKGGRIILVAAVTDLVASLVVGVSPVTVAVLLVREGLTSLCEGTWT